MAKKETAAAVTAARAAREAAASATANAAAATAAAREALTKDAPELPDEMVVINGCALSAHTIDGKFTICHTRRSKGALVRDEKEHAHGITLYLSAMMKDTDADALREYCKSETDALANFFRTEYDLPCYSASFNKMVCVDAKKFKGEDTRMVARCGGRKFGDKLRNAMVEEARKARTKRATAAVTSVSDDDLAALLASLPASKRAAMRALLAE